MKQHEGITLTNHLSSEELESYVLNRASGARAVSLEEHALVCEECQQALIATELEVADLRRALRSFVGAAPVQESRLTVLAF